jgi:hypothetical protein
MRELAVDSVAGPGPGRRLSVLVAAVWTAAVAGAVLGMVALVTDDEAPPPERAVSAAPAAPRVGDRVETSFGTMSVDYVARMVGGTAPMGVRTERGEVAIQVGVTLTNLERTPLRYRPSLFRVKGGRNGAIAPGRLIDGAVQPLSAHRFTVRYAVPATGLLPPLVFRDPGNDAPVNVPLGRLVDVGTLDVADHSFRKGLTP